MPNRSRSRLLLAASLLSCSSCANLDPAGPEATAPWLKACRPVSRSEQSAAERSGIRTVSAVGGPQFLAVDADESASDAPVPAQEPPAIAKDPKNSTTDGKTENAPAPEELIENGGISLAKLEEIALANNPTLRQAGLLVRQSEGNWLQVGLYPNPVVGYQAEEINDDGTAGKQGVFASQTIVTADKLELNRAAASWDIEQARWQADAQRWAVVNSVRVQFYAVLAAQRTVEVAEDLEKIVQQGVETAVELRKAGQVPETDVLQANLERNAVQIILRTARRRESGARRELAALLGLPELLSAPLAGTLDNAMPELDYELEWQKLAANSPALQFAQAQVEQARAQLRREEVQPIPDVLVQANALNDFATDTPVYGLQLGIALPVHNKNQGNIAAAHAALHQAAENIQRLELTLRQQLAQAIQQYEVAQTQAELYRDEILPTAQEALDLTTQGYRAGEVGFLRVLTVRRTYVENQINYIATLQDLKSAAVDIEGLLISGGLNLPAQVLGQFGSGRGGAGGAGGGGGGTRPLTATPKTE